VTQPEIQWFDELAAEFSRVATETGRRGVPARIAQALRPVTRLGVIAALVCGLVLLAGGAYAVPTTRAAIDDITSSFAAWIAGDDQQAPGTAVRPEDDAPEWIREDSGRLIAESDGVGLYVTRRHTQAGATVLTFLLGKDGNGIGDSVDAWREKFDDHALIVLGTTPAKNEGRERLPLLGVTARSVKRVSLRYADGPPLVSDGINGGFVLIADPRRAPQEIIAYDAAGRELEHFDVSGDRVTAFGVQGQD
jgi:hypothetical protein